LAHQDRASFTGSVRRRGGFTLVEVLVALVVGGIVAGALVSILLGQTRFYERNESTVHAQQNLRAAVDLMSAELRLASPADLIEAELDSVSVRFAFARAVVCAVDPVALTTTLFVFDNVTNANLPAGFRGTAYSGPYSGTFAYADNATGTVVSSGAGPRGVCVAAGTPGTGADADYIQLSTFPFQAAAEVGGVVQQYRRLTYRFANSVFGSGVAIWRGSQELVGPFDTDSEFNYWLKDGTKIKGKVPDPQLSKVNAIRIVATAVDESDHFDVERSLEFDIPLRN